MALFSRVIPLLCIFDRSSRPVVAMFLPIFVSLTLSLAQAQEDGAVTPQPLPVSTPCDEALRAKGKSADQLNSQGMRCYKEGRFEDAGRLFESAIRLDEGHALAHYNLACVIGLLFATEGPCDMNFDWDQAIQHLRQSIAADPARAERAKVDSDLDSLREMMAFRLAVNGSPETADQTAALYDGVTLWGETPGVHLLALVSFQRTHPTALTGTVSGWKADWNLEEAPVHGTWRADGKTIIVDWAPSTSKDGENSIPGSTETIRLEEMNHYGHGGWYTSPDYCSA